jgi:hypothetical protein
MEDRMNVETGDIVELTKEEERLMKNAEKAGETFRQQQDEMIRIPQSQVPVLNKMTDSQRKQFANNLKNRRKRSKQAKKARRTNRKRR